MTTQISKPPQYATDCMIWKENAEKGEADYNGLGDFLKFHSQSEKLHSAAVGYGLYIGHLYWTSECPYELGRQYNYDFYEWAFAYCGKEKSEVDQYKRVGELMESVRIGDIAIPSKVQLIDKKGNPVYMNKNGETLSTYTDGTPAVADPEDAIPVEVEPNIFSPDVSYTKLLLSRKVATSEEGLTEQQWGALFNPDVKVEPYRQLLLQDDRYGWDDNPDKLKVWHNGRCIIAEKAGEQVPIVDANGVNEEAGIAGNTVFLETWDKLCKCYKIENVYASDF